MRAAYYKLWGVDITDRQIWSQPREVRTLNPVAFTPDELAVDVQEEAEAGTVKKQGAAIIYPPPKPKICLQYHYEDEDENKPP